MHVLVTGAEGFIGRHLLELLRERGHDVTATSRVPTAPHAGVPFTPIELLEPEPWRALLHAARPDAIVHLAGLTSHADPGELYRVNVVGTETMLKAIAALEGSRPNVLLTSTAAVYGNQPSPVLDEQAPPRPVNHYGLTKLAMEQLGRSWADQLPIRVLRPFNVIGRGQSEAFLVPKVVRHFVQRAQTIELGNLKPERDFLDVRDFVAQVGRLAELAPTSFDVVNLCSGVGASVEQILELLEALTGHRLTVTVNPAFVRKNEVWRIIGDDRKLRALTGLRPRHSLRDTLAWMLEPA